MQLNVLFDNGDVANGSPHSKLAANGQLAGRSSD